MIRIEEQLQAIRQNLLDLTLRNRLLHFRPTKARTLEIKNKDISKLYHSLILREQAIEFSASSPKLQEVNTPPPAPLLPLKEVKPTPVPSKTHKIQYFDSLTDLLSSTYEREEEEVDLPSLELEEEEYSILGEEPEENACFLETSLEEESLQKHLSLMNQQARSFVEEQGYTILYLALGFLQWTEGSETEEPLRAPLLLIPVELERHRLRLPFTLRWTREDILSNISLQAKLAEYQVSLPSFEMGDERLDVERYFKGIRQAIEGRKGWKIQEDLCLDFFSFTKFVMYKDLDEEVWPTGMSPAEHPLIRAILSPNEKDQIEEGIRESEMDEKLTVRDTYHILDADPSQMAVIAESKAGKSLVVEGPPGTGKSQTITNIIAELLASGKSVLFVSEKMVALEVVKKRLDQAGIGDFCLELHSRKSNKKDFLEELKRVLSLPSLEPISMLEERCGILENLKKELNGYAQALREPFGRFGRSPFELFEMKEEALRHFKNVGRNMPPIRFTHLELCHAEEWAKALEQLKNMVNLLPSVKPLAQHPWQGCEPSVLLPSDRQEIGYLLEETLVLTEKMEGGLKELLTICDLKILSQPKILKEILPLLKEIAQAEPIDRSALLNPEWYRAGERAENLIHKVEKLQ
jgi:hypothetical protein